MPTTPLTARQVIARLAYRRGAVTQAELARRFGVTRSAICRRLAATRALAQRLESPPSHPAIAPTFSLRAQDV